MGNIIVAGIILGIFGLSISKIVREKKRGAKCVGCPHGGATKSGPKIVQLKTKKDR